MCHLRTGVARREVMKLRLLVLGVTACSGLALTHAPAAHAAPAPACTPATVTPQAATVPANLPAFGYTATNATTSDVRLFSVTGPRTELPLTVGPAVEDGYLKVAPAAALVAGTSYELEYQPFCAYAAYPTKPLAFVASAEAPLPTTLGAVTSGPTVSLADFGTTQVTIAATYSIAAEMKPWAGVYVLGVVFDGRVVETHAKLSAAGDSVQIDATGWC